MLSSNYLKNYTSLYFKNNIKFNGEIINKKYHSFFKKKNMILLLCQKAIYADVWFDFIFLIYSIYIYFFYILHNITQNTKTVSFPSLVL